MFSSLVHVVDSSCIWTKACVSRLDKSNSHWELFAALRFTTVPHCPSQCQVG